MRSRQRAAIVAVVTLLLVAATFTSAAASSWLPLEVKSRVDAFQILNNTGSYGQNFHMYLKGVSVADLDPNGYLGPDMGMRTVFQDKNGVHIYWQYADTDTNNYGTFGYTLIDNVQPTGNECDWCNWDGSLLGTCNGTLLTWQSSGGTVTNTIADNGSNTKWFLRTGGYDTWSYSIWDLMGMSTPPNAITIDPVRPLTPTEVTSGGGTYYGYYAYPGYKSYFMFYDVFSTAHPYSLDSALVKCDSAVTVGTKAGTLTFAKNKQIPDYFWDPTSSTQYNTVLSFTVQADWTEDVSLNSIGVNPSDNNDSFDPADIASVDVWVDVDNDGVVTPSVDQKVGTGWFVSSDTQQQQQITLDPGQVVIPAGGSVHMIISYTFSSPPPPAGNGYRVELSGAAGTGNASAMPAWIKGLYLEGNSVMIGAPAVTVAQAKQLPLDPDTGMGPVVLLQDTLETADFQNFMESAYFQDSTGGIGVVLSPSNGPGPIATGSHCSVIGQTELVNGAELMFVPLNGSITAPTSLPSVVAMNHRATGGGAFGRQPGLIDDTTVAPPVASVGLNNVGSLIRICGQVTGNGSVWTGETWCSAVWIDDGRGLWDGLANCAGIAVAAPEDWSGDPPSGYIGVTGILRAVLNKNGQVVRLLVPRSTTDVVEFNPVPPLPK